MITGRQVVLPASRCGWVDDNAAIVDTLWVLVHEYKEIVRFRGSHIALLVIHFPSSTDLQISGAGESGGVGGTTRDKSVHGVTSQSCSLSRDVINVRRTLINALRLGIRPEQSVR